MKKFTFIGLAILCTMFASAVFASQPVAMTALTVVSDYDGNVDGLARGSQWYYNDKAVDLGQSWNDNVFDSQTWTAAPAPIGFANSTSSTFAKLITVLDRPTPRQPTVYFKRTMYITDTLNLIDYQLTLDYLFDDAAYVYVNGTRILKVNINDGGEQYSGYSEEYGGTAPGDVNWISAIKLPTTAFKKGENVISVLLKNDRSSSSDLLFDMGLSFVRMNPTIGGADTLTAVNYTVPSYITALIAKGQAELAPTAANIEKLNRALAALKSKNAPYNVNATINGDPTNRIGFAWFSNTGVVGGKVQIVAKSNAQLSDFQQPTFTINATCTDVPNLNYILSRNTVEDVAVASLTGLANSSKQSYTSNKALATGLQPSTTYSYRVGGVNGEWSDIGSFTTASAGNEPFSFIYVTDTQANTDAMFEISCKTITAASETVKDAKFLLITGDLVESSGSSNSEWEWEQWFSTMQPTWNRLPIVPTVGNHDSSANNNMFHHFNTDTTYNATPGVVKSAMNGTNYCFVQGDALIFMLNFESYGTAGYLASLAQWMREQVAAYPSVKWRIACYHKNVYTGSNSHQSDSDGRTVRTAMAPVFDELKINVTLQGHDHVYEVIGPVRSQALVEGAVMKVETAAVSGVRENMTGKQGGVFNTYGGTLYFLNNSAGRKKYEPRTEAQMNGAFSSHQITDYWKLFTGKFGQTGEATFSDVRVTSDTIFINTYTVSDQGVPTLFDSFKVISDVNATDAKAETVNDVRIFLSDRTVRVEGTECDGIELFDISTGILCKKTIGDSHMSVADMKSGAYVVRVVQGSNNYLTKIIVR